jgi:hypothetical protein
MRTMTQEERARASLVELIKHVYQSVGFLEPLYYSELAARFARLTKHGHSDGQGMGGVSGESRCQYASAEFKKYFEIGILHW